MVAVLFALAIQSVGAQDLDYAVPKSWRSYQTLKAVLPRASFTRLLIKSHDRYSTTEYFGLTNPQKLEGSYVIFTSRGSGCQYMYYENVPWLQEMHPDIKNAYRQMGIDSKESSRNQEWHTGRVAKVTGIYMDENKAAIVVQFKDGQYGRYSLDDDFSYACMFNVDQSIYDKLN